MIWLLELFKSALAHLLFVVILLSRTFFVFRNVACILKSELVYFSNTCVLKLNSFLYLCTEYILMIINGILVVVLTTQLEMVTVQLVAF